MACCCSKTLNICDVSVCEDGVLIIDDTATAAGVHRLVLDYLDVKVVLKADLAEGDQLSFPTADLNELYQYTGKLFGPDSLPRDVTVDGEVYDCISFNTVQTFELEP